MLKLTVNRVFAAPKIRLVTRPRRQPKLQIASIHQLTTNNNTFQRLPNSISKTSKRLPHNMAEPQTVKTRILIISDTHSTPLQPTTSPNPFRQPLPSADILIHCGDLTMKGLTSEYHKTLDLLAFIDAPIKLVIAGNHDRTLDKTWMEKHQNHLWDGESFEEAREFWFGEKGRASREGVVMLEEGVHEVPLKNGGVLTVSCSFPIWLSLFTSVFYRLAIKMRDVYDTRTHVQGGCIFNNFLWTNTPTSNSSCLLMVTMGRCVEWETSNSSPISLLSPQIQEKATNIFLPKPALHIPIPTRILRLGFPLLETRRPLQHLQCPHRRQKHLC